MYARVTTAQGSPDRLDEAVRIMKERNLPDLKKERGYKGYLVLVDRVTGKGLTIALYETEADLKASEAAYQERAARVTGGRPGATVEVYEVAARD